MIQAEGREMTEAEAAEHVLLLLLDYRLQRENIERFQLRRVSKPEKETINSMIKTQQALCDELRKTDPRKEPIF